MSPKTNHQAGRMMRPLVMVLIELLGGFGPRRGISTRFPWLTFKYHLCLWLLYFSVLILPWVCNVRISIMLCYQLIGLFIVCLFSAYVYQECDNRDNDANDTASNTDDEFPMSKPKGPEHTQERYDPWSFHSATRQHYKTRNGLTRYKVAFTPFTNTFNPLNEKLTHNH